MRLAWAAVIVLVLGRSGFAQVPAERPSYDCMRARTDVEKTICDTPDLAMKDRVLAAMYRSAQTRHPDNRARLQEGQQAFLRERDACGELTGRMGAMVVCIDDAYLGRGDQLNAASGGNPNFAPFHRGDDNTQPSTVRPEQQRQASKPATHVDDEKLGLVFMMYSVAKRCADAKVVFTPEQVTAVAANIKQQLDSVGVSQTDRDRVWTNINAAIAAQNLTQADCTQTRQQMSYVFPPSIFAPAAEKSPF